MLKAVFVLGRLEEENPAPDAVKGLYYQREELTLVNLR
jgi:hypothetical protein